MDYKGEGDCKAIEIELVFFFWWEERIGLDEEIDKIYRLDEIQWRQKAGKMWILKGDANTQFFHQFANGRRRKNTISF